MVRTAGPIVVGVKEHQPWVLDRAKAEAERAGRPLRLVHAFTVPPTLVGVAFLDVPAAMRATSEQLLESASQRLREGGRTVPIERAVVRGAPGWVLEQESKHAELLVIGPDDAKHW
ncbi:MAG: universal stress protein, partial [Actinomycetales bacterium]